MVMAEWSATTVWWLVAGGLVAVELLTGTFYLLMLALGAALGALAAWSGMGSSAQLVVAALAGSAGVAVIHWRRRLRQRQAVASGRSNDMNLDVGASVQVSAWQPDGSTRVQHRGSAWDALYQGSGSPQPGEHLIQGVHGNRLLLTPRPPRDPQLRA